MSDAEKIKTNGWSQGAVIGGRSLANVDGLVVVGELYVVVSQDCDVVNRSFEVEPTVELIEGTRRKGPPDARVLHGKNPRVLHLSESDSSYLELDVRNRILIDRKMLVELNPESKLDKSNVRLLASWVAKRYSRPAFPDSFNERIRPAQKKINRALKSCGQGASGVFLMLDKWGEVCDGEGYGVNVIVTFPKWVAEKEGGEAKVADLAVKLMAALGDCEGISVLDSQHLAEDEFTLHDLRSYKRWDFDYRSHSGRPGGPTTPLLGEH